MNDARPTKIFGVNVFGEKAMREGLPRQTFEKLKNSMSGGEKLDFATADIVASAMKEWAISRGATHYTHWFHPRTELTAEKHMAFLTLDANGTPIESFNGEELIQSEPDASSLPSGGMRSTFEARGYTAWDPTSPAFVIPSEKGGTLCIPSVFISNDGTPLDMKTPLLRALAAVEERTLRILKLFGNRNARWTQVTMGAEQEFFLVDAEKAERRADLLYCARTLMGSPPPKGQQMEDHYFGSIHPRVLAFMEDLSERMLSLGMVLKTRHNEVAPCQFEFAPQFAEANLSVDQNQILMEQMRRVASRHGFRLLLHEKPFSFINGSGKHLNFSLKDSEGRNLLKPSSSQRKNLQFLTLLCSLLLGVSRFGGLLRASIATPGNMHRLGGNEAPPPIMSVHLGNVLTQILERIGEGLPEELPSKGMLDLGLNRLPSIQPEYTDRNRTAPIAYTGNKFEFRAPGASQSTAGPLTMILALWTWGMDRMAERIEARLAETDLADAALDAIKTAVNESTDIRYEGNCYSEEWKEEAIKRGLPVAETTFEALGLYLVPEHRELLDHLGIFTDREITAYYETRLEQYIKTLEIDMTVMESMVREGVLPALSKQIRLESEAFSSVPEDIGTDTSKWKEHIRNLVRLKTDILVAVEHLSSMRDGVHDLSLTEQSDELTARSLPVMEELRRLCQEAETVISSEFWPFPRYQELLNIS